MKIIFLDVDGVLNDDETLMTDTAINPKLVANLAYIVNMTGAKIVLSSSWRMVPNCFRILLNELNAFDLSIWNITKEGVPQKWLDENNIQVRRCARYDIDDDICFDRGAEIRYFLGTYPRKDEIENFVIIDDEDADIGQYFTNGELIKTNFKEGLVQPFVDKVIAKLNGKE